MQLLFLLVAGGGFTYLLTAHRRCDLFALAFAASCIYFMPGFFGSVPDGVGNEHPVPIETETYAVMVTVLGAILFGAWCWDSHGSAQLSDEPATDDRIATLVAFAMASIGLFMAVWTGGPALYSAYKDDVLEASSRWLMLVGFGASLSAVLAFAQRQWLIFLLSGIQLLFTVYIGFRSSAAMALMAILLVHFQRQGTQRLLSQNLPALLVVAASGATFFVYKCLYILVKMGDYGRVFELLATPDFYLDSFINSEPFTTQMVLNECLRTDFETDFDYIVTSVMAQLTLFSGELGLTFISFNDLFQPQLFADAEFGLAANIWAQMIAAGGWPLFLGFLAIFVWTLRLGSSWMATNRLKTRSGVALAAAYWAFYIHRNDLGYELSLLKRVLIVWVLIALVSEAIQRSQRASKYAEPAEAPPENHISARPALRVHSPHQGDINKPVRAPRQDRAQLHRPRRGGP